MIFTDWYHYLKGYLTIYVDGSFFEKFLNYCTKNNIYLWNIRKMTKNRTRACISARDFKKIRKAVKVSRTKVHIAAKTGAPFVKKRYRKRKVFAIGLIVCLFMIWFLSKLVWSIDVEGVEQTDMAKINEILSENGLKRWVFTNTIDDEEIKQQLRLQTDTIAWVGIDIKGSKVVVSIKEREMPPEIVPMDEPCHITAKSDAVITNILARNGDVMVKVGDTVTRDQILVSGAVVNQYGTTRYMHSIAEITGNTWYEKTKEQKLYVDRRVPTGNKKKQKILNLFGFNINLSFWSGNPYTDYDIITTKSKASKNLPFAYREQELSEVNTIREPLTEEEALKMAEEELSNELLGEHTEEGFGITKLYTENNYIDDETMHVKVVFECTEQIGQTTPVE